MRDERGTTANESLNSYSSLIPHPLSLPLLSLLTDFGTADYFVGAMKGALLAVNPQARIVDLTHEIPPHDIQAGAFTLLAAYRTFPPGTIHVGVVDPGVGSSRRPILVLTKDYFFVGPDNGLFSYIYERESAVRVFHLTNRKYFRPVVSTTFHGRDLFAPVAGAVSLGVRAEQMGDEITDYMRLEPLAVKRLDGGAIEGSVIHVDRFGNCITNITRDDLTEEMLRNGARLVIRGREISDFRKYFSEAGTEGDKLFGIWGSAGFLEVAAFQSSAAHHLGIERGERVLILTD